MFVCVKFGLQTLEADGWHGVNSSLSVIRGSMSGLMGREGKAKVSGDSLLWGVSPALRTYIVSGLLTVLLLCLWEMESEIMALLLTNLRSLGYSFDFPYRRAKIHVVCCN